MVRERPRLPGSFSQTRPTVPSLLMPISLPPDCRHSGLRRRLCAPDGSCSRRSRIGCVNAAASRSRRSLSGHVYARKIAKWRSLGYHVKLIFLSLPNADVAVARVATRVAQGGHNVPDEVIRRRFKAGMRNFDSIYKKIVDAWALYDNSGSVPKLLDWGERS